MCKTDDYDGYNGVRRREGITAIACMAHARRYYLKAIDHPKYADTAIGLIKELYAVEDEARNRELCFEERRRLRQEKSAPVMARFKTFLQENRPALPPSCGIAKAFDYTLNNWNELSVFLNDGEVEIDNNLIENAIRPLALGRKNWMFAGSANGAKWASTAYTIIATAKLHGLDPYAYICLLLRKLPGLNSSEIDQLLPWNLEK